MDDKPKKKVVLKKAGGEKKPVIRLSPAAAEKPTGNAPPASAETTKDAEPSTGKLKTPDKKGTGEPASPQPPAEDTSRKSDPVFKFYCVYCGQKLSASQSAAGKRIKCPACDQRIVIPDPPTE